MSTKQEDPPLYEWTVAEAGDSLPPIDTPVDPARIALYVKTSGDNNPIYSDEKFAQSVGLDGLAVPASMAMRVAPTRRALIMSRKGYKHPMRPTPFARWECKFFAPMKPGDVITSEPQMYEKFEKRGRKYVVWKVTGRNQRGEVVVVIPLDQFLGRRQARGQVPLIEHGQEHSSGEIIHDHRPP